MKKPDEWPPERIALLVRENKRLQDLVNTIAHELGCDQEEGHRHSHGRCIWTALYDLIPEDQNP